MRFYEVTAETEYFGDEENEKIFSDKKKRVLRKTDGFFREHEEDACVFMVVPENKVELAVAIKNGELDETAIATAYLEKLEIPYQNLSVKEISLTAYMQGIRTAYRERLISDDDDFVEHAGLENFWCSREDYFNDKVADDKKTVTDLKADVDKFHLGEGYAEELERVLSGKKRKAFLGNPANYFIITRDDTARRVMARDLISALYKRGRLQSRRYTIINLQDSDCTLAGLEEFYDVNQGATVYLKVAAANFPQGDQSRGILDMKHVCEVVKKKGAKTLTIFSMDEPSDQFRAKIEDYMTGVPLVTFTDVLYKKESARKAMSDMAAAENFKIPEEMLEKVEKSERAYTYGELVEAYNVWRAEYMGSEVFPEYKNFVTHVSEEAQAVKRSDAYATLQKMIGLTNAKKVIDGAIDYFRLQREIKKRGIPFNRPAMHMCFTGYPGTAKTTVARLVAEILKDNDVLSEGKLIEVGRGQLVGEYVGHTAPRVREAFKRAKGSVLFIDEAYSLVDDRKGSYGSEAINTIVQEMENRREDTLVILAGYPDEMKQLLEWNPGMKSRVAFHVHFDDYTEVELLDITKLIAEERGMLLDKSAEEKLLKIFANARKDKAFGNGRFARNLLEQAKFTQAKRILKMDLRFVSDDELRTLTADDFDYETKTETERKFGFSA